MDRLATILSTLSHLDLKGQIVLKESVQSGLGGTCDVFTAWSNKHNCKVAVKRIRVFLRKDEKFAKRLAKEVRIWAVLDHECVLPFLGYFVEESDVMPSLVSLWMENGTVDDFMNGFPRGGQETWNMLTHIIRGLDYLHSKGVIHADLKSDGEQANILISKDLMPQLTDFGLSTALSSSATVTFSATGTVRWMAIELFAVRPEDDDSPIHTEATDVWAFGMVAYELLSGKIPFKNHRVEFTVPHAITKGELPAKPPNEHNFELFGFLWRMCQVCWRTVPQERPTAKDLATFLSSRSDPLRRPPLPLSPVEHPNSIELNALLEQMSELQVNPPEPNPLARNALGFKSDWNLVDAPSPMSDFVVPRSPVLSSSNASPWNWVNGSSPASRSPGFEEGNTSSPANLNNISASMSPNDSPARTNKRFQAKNHTLPYAGLYQNNDKFEVKEYTDDGEKIHFYVKALYDYKATIDEEFDFVAGDIIAVTATPEDGWWSGTLVGGSKHDAGRHLFPSNFVCLV